MPSFHISCAIETKTWPYRVLTVLSSFATLESLNVVAQKCNYGENIKGQARTLPFDEDVVVYRAATSPARPTTRPHKNGTPVWSSLLSLLHQKEKGLGWKYNVTQPHTVPITVGVIMVGVMIHFPSFSSYTIHPPPSQVADYPCCPSLHCQMAQLGIYSPIPAINRLFSSNTPSLDFDFTILSQNLVQTVSFPWSLLLEVICTPLIHLLSTLSAFQCSGSLDRWLRRVNPLRRIKLINWIVPDDQSSISGYKRRPTLKREWLINAPRPVL